MTVGTVVCRSSRSWGSTQTDSRMIEKVQQICQSVSIVVTCSLISVSYLFKTPIDLGLQHKHHKRRHDPTAHQTQRTQLPCLFPLPRPRIDAQHQEQNVQRAEYVEDLEDGVPCCVAHEDVEVAGDEYEAVEALRDEGDAFGGLVAVYGYD